MYFFLVLACSDAKGKQYKQIPLAENPFQMNCFRKKTENPKDTVS